MAIIELLRPLFQKLHQPFFIGGVLRRRLGLPFRCRKGLLLPCLF